MRFLSIVAVLPGCVVSRCEAKGVLSDEELC